VIGAWGGIGVIGVALASTSPFVLVGSVIAGGGRGWDRPLVVTGLTAVGLGLAAVVLWEPLSLSATDEIRLTAGHAVGPLLRTSVERGVNLFVLLGQRALGLLIPIRGVRINRIITQGDSVHDVEARVEASRQVPGDAEGLLAGQSETVADND